MFTSPNRRESPSTDLSSYSLSYTQANSSSSSTSPPTTTNTASLVQENVLPPLRFQASKPSAFDLLISTAAYQWELLNNDKNASQSSSPSSNVASKVPTSTPVLASTPAPNSIHVPPTSLSTTSTSTEANAHQRNAVFYSYSYQVKPSVSSSANNITVTKTNIQRKRALSHDESNPAVLKKSPKLEISNLVSGIDEDGNNEGDKSKKSSKASSPLPSYAETKKDGSSSPVILKLCSPSSNAGRQRSGPSCDCCRSRKIKCDAEIIILPEDAHELIPATSEHLPSELVKYASSIASCEFIAYSEGYQYFKINHPVSTAKYSKSNYSYLKFKQCQACSHKEISCCFSRGITRNDIARYNKVEKKKLQSDSKPTKKTSDGHASAQLTESQAQDQAVKLEDNGSFKSPIVPQQISPESTLDSTQQTFPVTISTSASSSSSSSSSSSLISSSSPSSEQSPFIPNYRRSSCVSCRNKKIKCFKPSNETTACSHCTKKGIACIY